MIVSNFSFERTGHTEGLLSHNPHTGAVDPRWGNGHPDVDRFRGVLVMDFDSTPESVEKVRSLLSTVGIKLP